MIDRIVTVFSAIMKTQLTKCDQNRKRVYQLGYRQGKLDKKRGLSFHLISHKDFLTHRILRAYQAGYTDGYLNENSFEKTTITPAA